MRGHHGLGFARVFFATRLAMLHGATEEGMLCTNFRAQVYEILRFRRLPKPSCQPRPPKGFQVWGFDAHTCTRQVRIQGP